MMCLTCGSDPCSNPSFCAACRNADRQKARGEQRRFAPLRPAPPPMELPKANLDSKNWKEIVVEAWNSPRWKQAAAEYHHTRGNNVAIAEILPEDLARLRRLMGDDISLERAWAELNDSRNRPTSKATVDAILFAVRTRGLAALQEPATKARVASCDARARAEINKQIEEWGARS